MGTGFIVTDNYYSYDGSPTNEGRGERKWGEGGKGEPHPGVDIKNSMETPSRPKGQRAISQPDVDITANFFAVFSFCLSTSVQSLRSTQKGNLLPVDKG